MNNPFNPIRFLTDVLLVSLGAGAVGSLTMVLVWAFVVGNGLGIGEIFLLFVVTLIFAILFALPISSVTMLAGRFLPVFVPRIPPSGILFMLMLVAVGIGFSLLIALLTGVTKLGVFGDSALLAVLVGGACVGLLSSRKVSR